MAPLYAVISVPNIPTAAPKKKKGFFGGSKAKAAAAVGVGDGSMPWTHIVGQGGLAGGEGPQGCLGG